MGGRRLEFSESETIVKCFRKCGIIIFSESVPVTRIGASDDVDEVCELRALVGGLPDTTCSELLLSRRICHR